MKTKTIKIVLLSLFCLFTAFSINCYARDVSGSLHGNVQWSGEIHIIGDVVVESDAILRILPGTIIRFAANQNSDPWEPLSEYNNSDSWIIVMGRLIAEGTPDSWITFTSDANDPTPGDWGGILFHSFSENSTMESSLRYCLLEYGTDIINTTGDPSNSLKIYNSIIRHAQDVGILLGVSADVDIQFNTIYFNNNVDNEYNNCHGIEFYEEDFTYKKNIIIKNNIISNNTTGIANYSGGSYTTEHNNVWGNNRNYNTWDGQISHDQDISTDPLFTDINSGDITLLKGSPSLTASECGGEIGAYGTCSDNAIVPNIKGNGSDGPVELSAGETLNVTISLNAGDHENEAADWWVLQLTPDGKWYYLDLKTLSMVEGFAPTLQAGLVSFGDIQLLGLSGLQKGAHYFCFGVDLTINGVLNLESLYYDYVQVNVKD